MNESPNEIWQWVVFILTIIFLVIIGIIIFFQPMGDYPKYESPKDWCERQGGKVFYGGALSADNCVFPPK